MRKFISDLSNRVQFLPGRLAVESHQKAHVDFHAKSAEWTRRPERVANEFFIGLQPGFEQRGKGLIDKNGAYYADGTIRIASKLRESFANVCAVFASDPWHIVPIPLVLTERGTEGDRCTARPSRLPRPGRLHVGR